MNPIAILTDKDIFPKKAFPPVTDWIVRKTVKIILRNDEGKIALVTNATHQCRLLPGGGIDDNEEVLAAADRECREEARYSTTEGKTIGIIEEYRARDKRHYETYGVIARTKDAIPGDYRTDDEKRNELTVEWYSINEIRNIFKEQEKRLRAGEIGFYNTGFNIIRDKLFFDKIYNTPQAL